MMSFSVQRRYGLSSKLVVLFIIMAILIVILVSSAIRHAFQGHFKQHIRPHITQYLEYVTADIGTPPNRDRAQQLAERLKIEIQIIDRDNHWSSSGRLTSPKDMEIEREFVVNGKRFSHAEYGGHHYLRVDDGGTSLLFNVPNLRDQRRGFRGWVPILILLLLLLVLFYATRRLFAPLETIKQGVRTFGNGDVDHRITIKRKDELGELADNFNNMAEDIQQMLDAKRQLLLAISHELRSPLTRARLAAEMLHDDDKKAQIIQDLKLMETLIEELMESERLSSRHHGLQLSTHNIVTLLEDTLTDHFGPVDISAHLPSAGVKLEVDAARIQLLVKNLLDNAVRHTPEGAPTPEIELESDEHTVVISVIDHGEGIDAQHLPHLTEPFYRVDRSRQRDTGGYGLGLYLCKMIAEAHHGELEIDSHVGKGTRVIVTLPARD
jgi:signal transduction histidine kinase